jgi:hypothetical protein
MSNFHFLSDSELTFEIVLLHVSITFQTSLFSIQSYYLYHLFYLVYNLWSYSVHIWLHFWTTWRKSAGQPSNQDTRVASFCSDILQISTWFSYYLFECNSIICFRLKTFDLFYNLGKKFWQEMNIYGVLLNIKSLQIKSKNSINLPLNRCISLFWSFCSVSSLSTLDLRRSKPC